MHEKSLRLPGRLMSVAADDATAPPVEIQLRSSAPTAEPKVSPRQTQELSALLTGLGEAIGSIQQYRRELAHEMRQATVDLALTVASRLCRASLEEGRFNLEAMVRDAVQRLETQQKTTVALHPDDLALLREQLQGAGDFATRDIQLVADATLTRGSCVARAGDVTVTADLQAQLTQIHQHLRELVARSAVEPGLQLFPHRHSA